MDKTYFKSNEFKDTFLNFFHSYDEWIAELENNTPSFSPFKRYSLLSHSMDFINDRNTEAKDLFKEIDISISDIINQINNDNPDKQLIELFNHSTELVVNKYKLDKF